MSNITEKTYVNSIYFDELTFSDGNSILKASVKDINELIKFLKANANKDNSIKLVISKKKNQKEGSSTHYAYVDTWQPKNTSATSKPNSKTAKSSPQEEDPLI